MNHSKCAHKRYFNVSSHKHSVTKPLNSRNILKAPIYFYKLVSLYFIFHHNFYNNVYNFFKCYDKCKNFSGKIFLNYDSFIDHVVNSVNISNILHTQVIYPLQIVFMLLFSIFVKITFFIQFFNDMFYVNITDMFDSKLYITGLLNKDNKFLYCNCKVTGENIKLFQQGNKFKVHKLFIRLENYFVVPIIIFNVFSFFSRKQKKCLRLFCCFLVFKIFFFFLISN